MQRGLFLLGRMLWNRVCSGAASHHKSRSSREQIFPRGASFHPTSGKWDVKKQEHWQCTKGQRSLLAGCGQIQGGLKTGRNQDGHCQEKVNVLLSFGGTKMGLVRYLILLTLSPYLYTKRGGSGFTDCPGYLWLLLTSSFRTHRNNSRGYFLSWLSPGPPSLSLAWTQTLCNRGSLWGYKNKHDFPATSSTSKHYFGILLLEKKKEDSKQSWKTT